MSTTAPRGSFEPSPIVTASALGDGRRRAQRIGPLVHELLAWDFVRQTEAGDFELCDEVTQRLRATISAHPSPSPSVFVGRPCQGCGAAGRLTRLVEGVRLCAACSAPEAPPAPSPEGEPAPLSRHGHRRWRRGPA